MTLKEICTVKVKEWSKKPIEKVLRFSTGIMIVFEHEPMDRSDSVVFWPNNSSKLKRFDPFVDIDPDEDGEIVPKSEWGG